MTPDDTSRIFEKLDEHGQRITRVEECVKQQGTANGLAHKQISDSISRLGGRLTSHLEVEDANLRELQRDVHWLRGYVQAQKDHKERNPALRAVLWVLRLFGWKA